MYDFFTREKRSIHRGIENDDVLISDYIKFPTKEIDIPSDYKNRINKDLAHLTFSERIADDARKWNLVGLAYPILERAKDFIEHLLKDYPDLTKEQYIEFEECLKNVQEYLEKNKPK